MKKSIQGMTHEEDMLDVKARFDVFYYNLMLPYSLALIIGVIFILCLR